MASQWETPPWMIGGGVRHSVNVARLLSFAAFNGEEGIIGPKDLEVRERSTPGAGVRVYPGACSVLNRGAGIMYESYAGRLMSQDLVDVAGTGGSSRADLIVVRVENPFQSGEPWPTPDAATDPNTVQYIKSAVISGVAADAATVTGLGLGYSAIPLARINLPANTSTVRQAHITDLRRLTTVRRSETFNIVSPTATRTLTAATYTNWPSDMNLSVEIPAWATHMQARAMIYGVAFGTTGTSGQGAQGNLRISLGNAVYTESTVYNVSAATGVDRTGVFAGSPAVVIPAAMRGTTSTLRVEGNKTSGVTSLSADTGTTGTLEVRFIQRPESNV